MRITNFIMPNNSSFSGSAVVDPKNETIPDNSYYHFHWHVAIDDYNHWKYRLSFRTDGPLDRAYCDAMVDDGMGEGDNRLRRPENRYLQNRGELGITYTGMGQLPRPRPVRGREPRRHLRPDRRTFGCA